MSDYLERILLRNERVLKRIPFGRENFISLLVSITYLSVVFWLIHLLINLWKPLVGQMFLFLTGLWLVKLSWLIMQEEYVITDRRIIEKQKTSLFSEQVNEFFLHRVERIIFKQEGILNKMLNLGSFEITGSGNKFDVYDVPNPTEFRRVLDEAIIAAKERERRIGRDNKGVNERKNRNDEEDSRIVRIRGVR